MMLIHPNINSFAWVEVGHFATCSYIYISLSGLFFCKIRYFHALFLNYNLTGIYKMYNSTCETNCKFTAQSVLLTCKSTWSVVSYTKFLYLYISSQNMASSTQLFSIICLSLLNGVNETIFYQSWRDICENIILGKIVSV